MRRKTEIYVDIYKLAKIFKFYVDNIVKMQTQPTDIHFEEITKIVYNKKEC